jgi:hypothetical protein
VPKKNTDGQRNKLVCRPFGTGKFHACKNGNDFLSPQFNKQTKSNILEKHPLETKAPIFFCVHDIAKFEPARFQLPDRRFREPHFPHDVSIRCQHRSIPNMKNGASKRQATHRQATGKTQKMASCFNLPARFTRLKNGNSKIKSEDHNSEVFPEGFMPP